MSPQIYDKSGNIVGSIGEHPFGTEMGNLQNMEKAIPRVGLGGIASAALFGVLLNSFANMVGTKVNRKNQNNLSKSKIKKSYVSLVNQLNTIIDALDELFPFLADELTGDQKKKLDSEINFLHKFHVDMKTLLVELDHNFNSEEYQEILNAYSNFESTLPEFQNHYNAIAKELGGEKLEIAEEKSMETIKQTSEDTVSKLERLFSLKELGAITEDEYLNLKSKYL